MTGKQFELEVLDDYEYVIAEFDKDNYYLDDENSAKSLECRLNELFEENEQLRKDATTLIYSNQDYRKENEQLKRQIHYLKVVCRNELDDETLKQVMGSLGDME